MIAPKPKPCFSRVRKRMTIVAGFQCLDGIVLCSDTMEVYAGMKRHVSKLDVRGTTAYPGKSNIPFSAPTSPCAVFAGATEDADFLDVLIDKVWASMETRGQDGLNAMIEAAEDELIAQWQRRLPAFPTGMPGVTILAGIWAAADQFELVKIVGPTLKREIHLDAAGYGDILATYLASRFLHMKTFVDQAVPIGIYMVDQAKEHMDGCGGDTHLVVISANGGVTRYSSEEVKAETDRLRTLDLLARRIVGMCMEPFNSNIQFDLLLEQQLEELRKIAVIMPSVPETSEGQQ